MSTFVARLLTDDTIVVLGTEMRDGTVQISVAMNKEDFHELFGGRRDGLRRKVAGRRQVALLRTVALLRPVAWLGRVAPVSVVAAVVSVVAQSDSPVVYCDSSRYILSRRHGLCYKHSSPSGRAPTR